MKLDARYQTLRPEQRISSRAIAHAQRLADSTNGVITVLLVPMENCHRYDFACAYVDSVGAIYNALPSRYFSDSMRRYREQMHTYRLVSTNTY